MYFNLISPIEFNLISPVEFNLISPVGSNQKRFAKSTRISTRFLRWIQPDFKVACLLGNDRSRIAYLKSFPTSTGIKLIKHIDLILISDLFVCYYFYDNINIHDSYFSRKYFLTSFLNFDIDAEFMISIGKLLNKLTPYIDGVFAFKFVLLIFT